MDNKDGQELLIIIVVAFGVFVTIFGFGVLLGEL